MRAISSLVPLRDHFLYMRRRDGTPHLCLISSALHTMVSAPVPQRAKALHDEATQRRRAMWLSVVFLDDISSGKSQIPFNEARGLLFEAVSRECLNYSACLGSITVCACATAVGPRILPAVGDSFSFVITTSYCAVRYRNSTISGPLDKFYRSLGYPMSSIYLIYIPSFQALYP